MLNINRATYATIMLQATQAYYREDWLGQAIKADDNYSIPMSETIESLFSPYCDRLMVASTWEGLTVEQIRTGFLAKFTAMVLPD